MGQAQQPGDSYASIMGGMVEWLVEVYEQRLSQAKTELASAETTLGGLGYEERAERLEADGLEHPTPQRSLARLASWFGEIERELEERRSLVLRQQWESMAGEYALVSVQNLTEARQYLGLAQSAIANLLVSLATNKLNAWEKQTRLYGVRLYLERVETAFVWAIESATNGLRQHHLDSGSTHQPLPQPPRVSTGAVSYRTPPEPAPSPASPVPAAADDPAGAASSFASDPASMSPPAPDNDPPAPEPVAIQKDQALEPGRQHGLFGWLHRRKRPPAR